MRRCSRYLSSVAALLALCGLVYAAPVVHEHNGYRRPFDYDVTLGSRITIYRSSDPGRPYDFDCHEDSAPQQPAEILSITAVQGIGNVELMVCPHEGLLYGATNVRLLQLNQTGVTGSVLDLLISGDLGADGPTIFANGGSAEGGALDFRNALSPITITGRLLGNFTCNSAGDITIAGDVVSSEASLPARRSAQTRTQNCIDFCARLRPSYKYWAAGGQLRAHLNEEA